MEDLFRALMEDGQQQSGPGGRPDGDPLTQLLQGLMSGQAPQDHATHEEPEPIQGEIDFGSVLQGLLGSSGGPVSGAGQVPEEYSAQAEADPVQGGLDIGGLLQGMLGGTGGFAADAGQTPTSSAGEFGDILGAIMGGGSPTLESDSFLAPIVTGLAEKLGLPPQVAQAVVAFVLGKLMERRLQPGREGFPPPTRSRTAQPQATGLEDVVQRMNRGKRVTKGEIRGAGLDQELAAHTGLDRATAEASLQEVLNALGGQLGSGQ
jgi:hypothetical protein